ncbi:hemagglutinin [Carollia bat paramyxovirus]|nr:hemagglutinin [Carollia bat paramyxovirus]
MVNQKSKNINSSSTYYTNTKMNNIETPKFEDIKIKDGISKVQVTMGLITGAAGLVSLIVIIAMNVSSMVTTDKSNLLVKDLESLGLTTKEELHEFIEYYKGLSQPQITLINDQVSYKLPTQLSEMINTMHVDMVRICSPKYDYQNVSCPVVQNPVNSAFFSQATPKILGKCFDDPNNYIPPNFLRYVEYPSFIPGPTKPGGCTRIPSFSLSRTIFSYTHNIIEQGCMDHSASAEYWSIGKVSDTLDDTPSFETLISWYLNDGINRKSCSTVADIDGAWLACNIVTSTERDDYLNPGIMRIYLSYRDVFGRKREWYYNEDEITIDRKYNALYFSVGSGIIKDGNIIFLMYGGLTERWDVPPMCFAPECSIEDLDTCRESQTPPYFGSHQVVNAILYFKNSIKSKPLLTIKTISPSYVWFGAEGRLFYFNDDPDVYIYLRSSSWHALLQVGKFNPPNDLKIRWTTHLHASRPGYVPCNAASRCPNVCITGVYGDFFPFNQNYSIAIGGYLRSQVERKYPYIRMIQPDKIIGMSPVVNGSQEAAYSTTTCFLYKSDLWCLTIFEMAPATVGEFQPVPFVYRITTNCWRTRNLQEEEEYLENEYYKREIEKENHDQDENSTSTPT